jgi:hypothetical protein
MQIRFSQQDLGLAIFEVMIHGRRARFLHDLKAQQQIYDTT